MLENATLIVYRFTKLRASDTKRLLQRHPAPVLFPQEHTVPFSPPLSHSYLYITNEHLTEDRGGRSICSLFPITISPCPSRDPPRHSVYLRTLIRQVGTKDQMSHAQILSRKGWSKNCSLGNCGLPTARSELCSSIPSMFSYQATCKYQGLEHIESERNSPGWCGSVDWVPACKAKGHQFDSQSGHMPGMWARSPIAGMSEATTHWCFSPSLPCLSLSLKIFFFLK